MTALRVFALVSLGWGVAAPLFAYHLGKDVEGVRRDNLLRNDRSRLLTAHRDGLLDSSHEDDSQAGQSIRVGTGGVVKVRPELTLIEGTAGMGDSSEALARARHPAGKSREIRPIR
jgi:hypothetical protein